jgi:hypothetical protein
MKVAWADVNNIQEAGRYAFRDGYITVLEIELAVWRNHPSALFDLLRKHPIQNQVEYVLGNPELENPNREQIIHRAYELWEQAGKPDGRDGQFYHQAERELRDAEKSSVQG